MIGDTTPQGPLMVDRRSEFVAAWLVLAFWALAFWAAGVDWASEFGRNAIVLDWLSIIYKLIGVGALTWLGRRRASRSMWALALLVALLTLGSLGVHSDLFDTEALGLGGLFFGLALIAGSLVWEAYRHATPAEKPVVVRLIWILGAVGVFLGPVNAIASLGINREWLFAEDFGQVMSLAVLAGNGVGLVAATGKPSADQE